MKREPKRRAFLPTDEAVHFVGTSLMPSREPSGEHTTRRTPPRRPPPVFDTIDSAAAKLSLDVEALRARCRRAAVRVGAAVQAHLGGGIVAFKFGRSWRVRFPPA